MSDTDTQALPKTTPVPGPNMPSTPSSAPSMPKNPVSPAPTTSSNPNLVSSAPVVPSSPTYTTAPVSPLTSSKPSTAEPSLSGSQPTPSITPPPVASAAPSAPAPILTPPPAATPNITTTQSTSTAAPDVIRPPSANPILQTPAAISPPSTSTAAGPVTIVPTPAATSHQNKSKSGGKGRLLALGVLLLVLIGGAMAAYYLTTQNQEIRQQAQEVAPTPPPPSFSFFPPVDSGEITMTNTQDPDESITAIVSFDGTPTCNGTACRGKLKITPQFPDPATHPTCRLNTSNVVYYNMLTNPDDPNYPDNVAQPIGEINANCNRPLTYCKDGSDPNCATDLVIAYGPSQCDGTCSYYEADIPYTLRNQDVSCGCSQFDVNIAEVSFLCNNDTETITYRKSETDTSVGAYAYGYGTSQCSTPPTATPTPPDNPTATPTPPVTPPVGPMCLSISMAPTAPKLNDSVTFTCGQVAGITRYEFRYFAPGSTTPTLLETKNLNVSNPLVVTKSGQYAAQCRICPSTADAFDRCEDPTWGWETISTVTNK